jgi:hypothetical protein
MERNRTDIAAAEIQKKSGLFRVQLKTSYMFLFSVSLSFVPIQALAQNAKSDERVRAAEACGYRKLFPLLNGINILDHIENSTKGSAPFRLISQSSFAGKTITHCEYDFSFSKSARACVWDVENSLRRLGEVYPRSEPEQFTMWWKSNFMRYNVLSFAGAEYRYDGTNFEFSNMIIPTMQNASILGTMSAKSPPDFYAGNHSENLKFTQFYLEETSKILPKICSLATIARRSESKFKSEIQGFKLDRDDVERFTKASIANANAIVSKYDKCLAEAAKPNRRIECSPPRDYEAAKKYLESPKSR